MSSEVLPCWQRGRCSSAPRKGGGGGRPPCSPYKICVARRSAVAAAAALTPLGATTGMLALPTPPERGLVRRRREVASAAALDPSGQQPGCLPCPPHESGARGVSRRGRLHAKGHPYCGAAVSAVLLWRHKAHQRGECGGLAAHDLRVRRPAAARGAPAGRALGLHANVPSGWRVRRAAARRASWCWAAGPHGGHWPARPWRRRAAPRRYLPTRWRPHRCSPHG